MDGVSGTPEPLDSGSAFKNVGKARAMQGRRLCVFAASSEKIDAPALAACALVLALHLARRAGVGAVSAAKERTSWPILPNAG